ncbi:MAG: TIGR01777 family oxidoreductase [Desulfohalobiaceae bacterium]|nr:TIGR01777 family oxidoreductase [Desulfohalobiaceae bacterium]
MKVFITGGSGFVGSHLIPFFLSKGHQILASGTSPHHPLQAMQGFTYISADTTKPGDWQQELKTVDAIINLAGRNIFQPWNEERKKSIYDSRILTTRNLVDGLTPGQEVTLLNTSAVGYYGDRGEEELTEGKPPGEGFMARICRDWETEAQKAEDKGARVAFMRFAVVLSLEGGALPKMLTPFKLGLGGPLGSGRQWFPWIHLQDLMEAALFLLENQELTGPFNFCAPQTVRHKEFARTLGRVLGRPALLNVPPFALRLVLGELGRALLGSQRVLPERLQQSGFTFLYPDLDSALSNLLKP